MTNHPNRGKNPVVAQVLEDNGGGIHWATDDDRSCSTNGIAYGSSQAGKLLADLYAVKDWIDDVRNDRPDEADTVIMDEDSMVVIAALLADGTMIVNTEHMGASGKAYAGITE